MIFLDANVYLRFLVRPDVEQDLVSHEAATALFAALKRGEEEASPSESIIAEVALVLTSKKHYRLPPGGAVSFLMTILRLPEIKLPRGRKRLYARAAEIRTQFPALGFVDALTAATVERSRMQLATFDSDFAMLQGVAGWAPSSVDES